MENAVVRGRDAHPVELGDHVLVGPHAHVNRARIENEVFLATGVSVFSGARIGHGSQGRAGTTVPIGWIAIGDAAELFPPDGHQQLWPIQRSMDFPRTVFGLERTEATMDLVSARYAERFGHHRDDRLID
jgi:carbonic anhydrase/acetyltransferase-like protein (isoleucine patch superfamily)